MLSEKLKALMEKENLNMNQLSVQTGIPYSSISDWVKGATTPKVDNLLKLADFFGTNIEFFVEK